MNNNAKKPLKARIVSAFVGASVFVALMFFLDRLMNPEEIITTNYWIKKILFGLLMFGIYLLSDKLDIWWTDIFQKKEIISGI